MTDAQNLGTVIRAQRKRLGLSQREVAKQCGVSLSYISRIEIGRRYPSVDALRRMAKPLQMDARELFGLAGYLPDDSPADCGRKRHHSLAELDVLIDRVTADVARIRTIAKGLHKQA